MRGKTLNLICVEEFQSDIDALPDLKSKKMALDMLVLIRDGKVRGERLGVHVQTGDLTDCFKLYFDPDGSGKPKYRLVYRYTPDELHAIALEAIAVGMRDKLSVYISTAKRLGRLKKK